MKTILVVDDEPHLRMLVSTTLADDAHRILEAGDGETAVRLALANRPDLILLDWMMPGLPGVAVAQRLRSDPATRDIQIVMLTAKGQERDRREAMAVGLAGYLVKPFSPLELIERVRALLG